MFRNDNDCIENGIDNFVEEGGRGIAVANAISEVLEIADEVTLTNDEAGVAVWIERNIL